MTEASPTSTRPSGPAARMLAGLIRAYQWLPWPMGPSRCRFAPSCSHYGLEALAVHGAVRGTWLTIARLLRCNPFNSGGLDPVPPAPGSVMTPEAYVPREVST